MICSDRSTSPWVEWDGDVASCSCGVGWVEASLWGRRALAARAFYSARLEAVHAKPSEHLFLAVPCDFFSAED